MGNKYTMYPISLLLDVDRCVSDQLDQIRVLELAKRAVTLLRERALIRAELESRRTACQPVPIPYGGWDYIEGE